MFGETNVRTPEVVRCANWCLAEDLRKPAWGHFEKNAALKRRRF